MNTMQGEDRYRQSNPPVQLEICCGDLDSVIAARDGGASRIELCSGLTDGGLTPSIAMIRSAVDCGIAEINVLIRPRPGDFLYSDSEIHLMCLDIEEAVKAGATGVVIGALTPDGNIDTEVCSKLIETARRDSDRHVNITFHRAFDLARDAQAALEDVIGLKCDSLLTSGMEASAEAGIPLLEKLVGMSRDRITIMAGGGVNCNNAAKIISTTGVGAIHSTARSSRPSGMIFHREGVPMGAPGTNEYALRQTDAQIVASLLKITKTVTTCEK